MQHTEFVHTLHFQQRYHRIKAGRALSPYIDFFWETDFEPLYPLYPAGFSDALFANVGYTYLINLGTPFTMQLGTDARLVRKDAYLPRHKPLICHHTKGNKIFGIKFNVSPVVFQKKINFGDYREYLFPLAYLIQPAVLAAIKSAASFEERVAIATGHYKKIIEAHTGSLQYVQIVTSILQQQNKNIHFTATVAQLAEAHNISTRSLQRYFLAATSITAKKALQIMRIRNALNVLVQQGHFNATQLGYYDYSHFYKEAAAFLQPFGGKALLLNRFQPT